MKIETVLGATNENTRSSLCTFADIFRMFFIKQSLKTVLQLATSGSNCCKLRGLFTGKTSLWLMIAISLSTSIHNRAEFDNNLKLSRITLCSAHFFSCQCLSCVFLCLYYAEESIASGLSFAISKWLWWIQWLYSCVYLQCSSLGDWAISVTHTHTYTQTQGLCLWKS